MPLEFRKVIVTPYTELLDTPRGLSYHRGGPHWPDWDGQTVARHRLGGRPADVRPKSEVAEQRLTAPLAWGGAIVWHFGHQVADFSMRLLPTLAVRPDAVIAFASSSRWGIHSIASAPPYFVEILNWFGVAEEQVVFIDRPSLVERLFVVPQAEQLNRPNLLGAAPEVGPSASHLDMLDHLVEVRLGDVPRNGSVYVGRSRQHARFAGEAFLERMLGSIGVHVVHPEELSLSEQLREYVSAEHLVFAEGSAIHATKLLGRCLGDVAILTRRAGRPFAQPSLVPRARTLQYLDAAPGLVHSRHEAGGPAYDRGLSILSEDKLLKSLASYGWDLSGSWDSRAFAEAQAADLMSWLSEELRSQRGGVSGVRSMILSTVESAGLAHLSKEVATYIDSFSSLRGKQAYAVSQPIAQPTAAPGWSPRRINRLITALDAKSYLEIGVQEGHTLWAVNSKRRTGVDPVFRFDATKVDLPNVTLLEVSSDRFFRELGPDQQFDVIFIDGLHTFEQTYRDLCNSLLHVSPRSVLLLDDTWPSDVFSSLRDQDRARSLRAGSGSADQSWHGDVFKVVFAIHDFHFGLNYRTITGSGNPQTLVWRSNLWQREPSLGSLESISRLTYFDLLDHVDVLRPATEDEAIETCIAELTAPDRRS